MTIRALKPEDIAAWKSMRLALWPHLSDSENDRDAQDILLHPDRFAVFIAEENGAAAGFLDASLRLYADGCATSSVGFIEGWYVKPDVRGKGIGRELVRAAEEWARSKGCLEMASDTVLDNIDSQRAHARLGYDEVERQVCFRKSLI